MRNFCCNYSSGSKPDLVWFFNCDHITCSQSCRTEYNRRFWAGIEGRRAENESHGISPNSAMR